MTQQFPWQHYQNSGSSFLSLLQQPWLRERNAISFLPHLQGLYYLPSLARLGNNTLLLESLAIAYELTGDKKYLAPGLETFKRAIYEKPSTINGQKREEEDAVIGAGSSTKGFAQSFIPLITYYKALSENDMRL